MIAYHPIIQSLDLADDLYQVDVLRLDLLHPQISGNKWFKLKRNLEQAIAQQHTTIVTFGGAFSNHIAATAAACKAYNLKAIGIIRGEEAAELNTTLQEAKQNGMHLHFVSRGQYAQKNEAVFKEELVARFGPHYLIPEGGNNEAGLLGCTEILDPAWNYDHILCACGTGTTFAGLVASAKATQSVIGISILKGENSLPAEAEHLLQATLPEKKWKVYGNEVLTDLQPGYHGITNAYCFSGYAKADKELLAFKKEAEQKYHIPLDYIYTSKLFYAANDLIAGKRVKPGSKLLLVHSGGLQGNSGFEARYHLRPML